VSASEPLGDGIPAFVTAGGRLTGEAADHAGTTIKALADMDGAPLLARVIGALRATTEVGRIVVIGPKAELERVARDAGADEVLPEGATGPENLSIGLRHYAEQLGERRVLFAASDLPFLHETAIGGLLTHLTNDPHSDVVYPVIHRADYEAHFPDSPNTWARLAGQEYTGGSVLLLRPAAIERNRATIERVFAARKNLLAMASLLGPAFAFKFAVGRLTIPDVEARASRITGCRCRALIGADPRLAADVDTVDDLHYARRRLADAARTA
jgi:molybdopterin-guanine dinucleotide biosynthesis protein A